MTETHIHGGGLTLLPLLATNARTLDHRAGPCAVCQRALLPGERVADLPDGRIVHVAGCSRVAGAM